MTGPPALELKNLHKRFGQTEVIRGLSLAVQPGERIGIIGPNGAGKSTLFDLISGRQAPDSGQVLLHGQRIDGKKPFQINRLGLSRSFQISSLFANLSVFDNLRCGLLWHLGYRYTLFRFLSRLDDANARTEQLMERVQLTGQRNTLAAHLSYAEQRALELGITLASGAGVILLDEPTAGMSRSEAAGFVQLIDAVTVAKTLLIIEHDMPVVFGLAGKIAVMLQGELLAFDKPEVVRADGRVQQAYLGVLPVTDQPSLPAGLGQHADD
ncbi:MAG: ABC transporter ATP-binding protein [Rhodoferax sp.]|jgi:branched-chain amino acid transport system ATP-binding protein|nr:ABC transporter ATP-binding protein [Rhodoferax sp.]